MSAEPVLAPDNRSASGRLRFNISMLALGQLVTWSLTAIWTLFVPRALGPAGMGEIVAAWSVTGIASVLAGMGGRTYLVREIAADRSSGPSFTGTALILRALLALPCALLIILYARLSRFDAEQTRILYIATIVAALGLLIEPLQAALQAIERMQYLAYADMLHKALLGVLGIGLVVLGYKATAQVWLLVVLAFGLLAISWWWYRGYMSIDWRLHVGRAKAFLRGSLSFWAFSLFFTFYLWVDSAMLLNLTPHQVVGWYGVATKLFGALMAIPIILATAWLPRMVVAFEERPESLRAVARTPIEDGLILSLAVAVGAALTAVPIIRLLYGSAFTPAAPVLVILAFTVIPMFFNSMVFQVLVARRKQVVWTAAMIFATIVNPLLNLWLIPHFQRTESNGAVGAAYALLATEIMIGAAGLVLVRGIVTLGTLGRLGRAAGAVALMGASVWAFGRFGLVPQVLVGLIVFSAAAIALKVPTPEERHELGVMVDRSRNWLRRRP